MPDLGKRVVLGEQGDSRTLGRADSRTKRRLEPTDAPLDTVACALEKRADRGKGMTLLLGKLGMLVDVPREQRELGRLGRGQGRHVAVYWLTQPFPFSPAGCARTQCAHRTH